LFLKLLTAWTENLADSGALNCLSVDLKDDLNGWVILAPLYGDPGTGFVRGYSNTVGLASASNKPGDIAHQIRNKYVKQMVPDFKDAFLKAKKAGKEGSFTPLFKRRPSRR
jgi:hypothetical protein